MADSLCLPSNQWNAGTSEMSHESSDFETIPAMHDASDIHDTIDKTESSRLSSSHTTLATVDFEPAEHCTPEYISKRQKVINDGPGHLSDQAINWIKAMEDVELEINDVNLSKSHKQAKKFSNIWNLNKSLVAKVKDLEAAEPVQGPHKELAAAHQEIDKLKKELRIEKHRSAKLERWLEKCKSELESKNQIHITQLWLEKDMLLHRVKSLSSEKRELESKLRAFERVVQRPTTNPLQATLVLNTVSELNPSSSENCTSFKLTPGSSGNHDSFEPTPGSSKNCASFELTPGQSGSHGFCGKSFNLPSYDGKQTLDDVILCLFAFERHFKNAAQAIGWIGTMGWGEQAVLQFKVNVAI
ncbi:hypothetical protein K440DRAFT_646585 [Wilcoxina mikolae CBS 423.85]|nr:hypothetical protein K440DRAFT_646585 [Wilcoxina mikolae CBS 423.85]